MQIEDGIRYSSHSIRGAPLRSTLMLIAMAIGVAAVITLVGLGESSRAYVLGQFSSMGSNLLIILPGRSGTVGGAPSLHGTTARDMTLGDANALSRIPSIDYIAPVALGTMVVSHQSRNRETTVIGSNAHLLRVRHLQMARGNFLPENSDYANLPVCIIGSELKRELFDSGQALGRWIRVSDRRYQVIGVLGEKGESIGINFENAVILPVKSAQALMNTSSLQRIFIEARSRASLPVAISDITRIIKQRHNGEEDVTIVSQDALLSSFDSILRSFNLGVAGIASISLVVAGIMIMNIMLVSVAQRSSEIGVLNAVGATPGQVTFLFLGEAVIMSLAGALLGILIALVVGTLLAFTSTDISVDIPVWAYLAGTGIALLTGLIFGIAPAHRAAQLDPVQALSSMD